MRRHPKRWLTSLCSSLVVLLTSSTDPLAHAQVSNYKNFNCQALGKAGRSEHDALQLLKEYIKDRHELVPENAENQHELDYECLNQAIRHNFFEVTDHLVKNEFISSRKRLEQAELVIRNAIKSVRQKQDLLLNQFQIMKAGDSIPIRSPAFRWAQSLKEIFLEVKFTVKGFDSPACLNTKELQTSVSTDGRSISISTLCTVDQSQLLRYKLDIVLFGEVMPTERGGECFIREKKKVVAEGSEEKTEEEKAAEEAAKEQVPENTGFKCDRDLSVFQTSSVGRLFIVLPKAGKQSKWKNLYRKSSDKRPNQAFWWDKHQQYEKELEDAKKSSDSDEDEMEAYDEEIPKPKKKKKKKKVKKSKGLTNEEEEL